MIFLRVMNNPYILRQIKIKVNYQFSWIIQIREKSTMHFLNTFSEILKTLETWSVRTPVRSFVRSSVCLYVRRRIYFLLNWPIDLVVSWKWSLYFQDLSQEGLCGTKGTSTKGNSITKGTTRGSRKFSGVQPEFVWSLLNFLSH